LLGQGDEFGDRGQRELSAGAGPSRGKVSGTDGNLQSHVAAEANQNVLNSGQSGTEGKQGKSLTEQRMRRVSNLDFDQFLFTWVVEGGIQLWDRS
jgi:hypothetical protein